MATRRKPTSPRVTTQPASAAAGSSSSGVTVWLFEDQLSPTVSALAAAPVDAPVLMVESDKALRAWPFHKKRLVFLLSSMRHFADELRAAGRTVAYYPLKPRGYRDSVSALIDHLRATGSRDVFYARPSEHHTQAWIDTLPQTLAARGLPGVSFHAHDNNLFLTDRAAFARWAAGRKNPIMEFFYRQMRATHRVLMQGDAPVGGQWNLDKLNRKAAPQGLLMPAIPAFEPDDITRAVMAEVDRRFPDHPGSTAGFDLPVTRAGAEAARDDFIRARLPLFGDYEDAMLQGQPHLFHSVLSPLINVGLLEPMATIRLAEKSFYDGHAPLNAVEGFVRQILGWREYVYGIYHTFMPEYRDRNSRGATRSLPQFFWSGDTDMNCLRQCVGGVVERAYSHHIQRLMIICNFATLAGLSPQAVNDWFYAMYADAHDWVVTPNVVGMGMASDGGTMATKPYVSSAAYINRMSDYCQSCRYNPKTRTGDDACPFNFLFWTFLHDHAAAYASNPRMTMMLKNASRISPAEIKEMLRRRDAFLQSEPMAAY